MKRSIKKTWKSFKKSLKRFRKVYPFLTPKHLIFYDGYCNLCHGLVRCILKKDKKGLFRFAPLQGETAKQLFNAHPTLYYRLDSLILVENYQTQRPRYWIKSKAVLRIAGLLGGWYRLFSWMAHLPGFLINPFYTLVAKIRFRLFGTTSTLLPDANHKGRFLG